MMTAITITILTNRCYVIHHARVYTMRIAKQRHVTKNVQLTVEFAAFLACDQVIQVSSCS